MAKKVATSKTIGCQVTSEIAEQIDAEAERLRAASPGARYTRSDVLRMILLRGLATK